MTTTTPNVSGFANGAVIADVVHGVAAVGKAVILTTGKVIDELDITTLKVNGTGVTAAGGTIEGVTSSAAELNLNDGTTTGTVVASKTVAVDANKAVDTLRATTDRNLGGTGVPGAATVQTEITKAVTAFSDTVAKTVFTVTIPNAAHNALIEVDVMGVLGAGGSIGAGEASRYSKYMVTLARTTGVNVVAGISAAIGGAAANVAGGQAITSVVATLAAVSGAVGASNTFDIQVAITRAGAGADNHTCTATARILNKAATGVTIA